MRVTLALLACSAAAAADRTCEALPPLTTTRPKPSVDGGSNLFIGGARKPWDGRVAEVTSPVFDEATGAKAVLGRLAQMDATAASWAADAASEAWDRGQGPWPQASLKERAAAIRAFLDELEKTKRDEIIEVLMWEIAKTKQDATKEFDRTVAFARTVVDQALQTDATEQFGRWTGVSGVRARVRRGPVGVTLMLAPYNYPLNEMYAMMMPALLMGNPVILKLPAIGALAHVLTVDALQKCLPKGVVNFVSGSGRETLPSVMQGGLVDCLGFIGGSKGADALIKQHPHPHRLKVFSQLEGKNLGIVFADADLDEAVRQILLGALSYNGQRCTAIKLVIAEKSVAPVLVEKLAVAIEGLERGLPWDAGVEITPLPEPNKPQYLAELVEDATSQGALIKNARGGATNGQLYHPALVYPVTPSMRLFHEEQFGPVVPVAEFEQVSEVIDVVKASWNGQQAAVFTSDAVKAAPLVDALSTIVGRVNVNMQCARGPDVFPFSGRRSSAMGTMSTTESLRAFSVETLVAVRDDDAGRAFGDALSTRAKFLLPTA
jgi:glyceraldehyde-3-phosphate dehydrogenase (NADP+)